ncbi:MAG: AraC family transcriptional regulator [Bacteroidales bacterium]|nr:AraC family transcriptional regulator [Bacteroidales bacterium]MBN2749348.1 AraC family transcriptional regulator [Bacteroidales bacterium]
MSVTLIDTKSKLEQGLLFKISRFKEVIKKTKPHKHDEYYELVFLSEGQGFHSIDATRFIISAPEVYLLKPGELHYWQFTSIPKGFVVMVKDDEFNLLREGNLIDSFNRVFEHKRIVFSDANFPENLLEDIFAEFQRNAAYSKDIIHGLLYALLGRLLQYVQLDGEQPVMPQSVYERFVHLLVTDCPRLHKVNQFAELLHTTPQNLNAACRKQRGKSASELVSGRLLLEAKRYILHTDNTISEVAHILSFTDASNFVKFFKRLEGVTPIQFREQYFQ